MDPNSDMTAQVAYTTAATLLCILYENPELTDYVATFVIKHRLPNWKDAQEAQTTCGGARDPLASGYWEYMVHVLGGDPESHWPTPKPKMKVYIVFKFSENNTADCTVFSTREAAENEAAKYPYQGLVSIMEKEVLP
jgi:hypothetical protein